MATKVIYFTVGGRKEQTEFRSDDNPDDVKDIFRAAAEAGPHDLLKLYNAKGNIVNISPKLAENTPDTCYKLEVIAAYCSGGLLAAQLGFDVSDIDKRIQTLEKKIVVDNGEMPVAVFDIKQKMELFREKLESVEHLSWLGLFKDMTTGSLQPFWNKRDSMQSKDPSKKVYDKFTRMCGVQVTEEVRNYLKKPTFDNWQWDDPEMLVLLRQMYIDLGFVAKFNIELEVLHNWLYEVYSHYNQVPFHNFKHCFMVSQMMYGLTWLLDLRGHLDDLDILILLTSAISHDLDHPGYNNAYQINARTELALRYNDISPLENHHCAVAFEILKKPNCNIFRNLPTDIFKKIREGMIRCILSTDMAKHSEILGSFRSMVPHFDFGNKDHRGQLTMILIKVADVSNECRPMEVAEPWIDCLLQEFFRQSDVEKLEGLPVAPFMDREKVNKPSSQVGFIKFVLLPLFQALADLFPIMEEHVLDPVKHALAYYTEMQKAMEEQTAKKNDSKDMMNGHKNGITTGKTKTS